VFTRVLTEHIGKVVHYRENCEPPQHEQARVRAVEAGVVTFVKEGHGLFPGDPDDQVTYQRIDTLAYVTPSTIFN
jgi:hypothetical protein